MTAKKKSFKNELNPALQFISTPEEAAEAPEREQVTPTKHQPPEGYKVNPLYIETKSKRLQLLLQPSLYEKIKARANQEGRSVNELVHSILEEATKGK